jgi:large subunit ribosomal protein L29
MTPVAKYREMTSEELSSALTDAGESVFKLKLQQKLGQLENKARITHVRRDIARIRTVLAERTRKTGEA